MEIVKTINVPTGYVLKNSKETVDVFTAFNILSSEKQLCYLRAEKAGENRIVMYSQYALCPHCGYSFLPSKLPGAKKAKDALEVSDWLDIQLSLTRTPRKVLRFHEEFNPQATVACKRCGRAFRFSNEKTQLIIGEKDDSVFLARRINSIGELMEIKSLNTIEISNGFPVYESIVFDFGSGKTFVQINEPGGEIICSEDVQNKKRDENLGILQHQLSDNKAVKRTLKRLFQKKWSREIPYSADELSFEDFIILTKHRDFSRRFYDSLPYDETVYGTEPTFSHIADAVKNPDSVVKLLSDSALPGCKTVKRIFYQNPELIFYIDECEFLYETINDVNLFCKVMKDAGVLDVLTNLHIYPLTKPFYKDYIKIIGKHHFCRQLSAHSDDLSKVAKNYCALSEFEKERERERWAEDNDAVKDDRIYKFSDNRYFSVRMAPVEENIKDCRIDGFKFRWLRKEADYVKAGTVLGNCLMDWEPSQRPVTAVYHYDRMVAAIELSDKEIFQAYQAHNQRIKPDSPLGRAVRKWMEKYDLHYHRYEDEEYYDDLPF